MTKKLLTENAAGRHAQHPFDLPQVTDGKSLIKLFYDAKHAIDAGTSMPLKIDGVNTSFKLIDSDSERSHNGKEFAVDRGAKTNVLDIIGITYDVAKARFVDFIDIETESGTVETDIREDKLKIRNGEPYKFKTIQVGDVVETKETKVNPKIQGKVVKIRQHGMVAATQTLLTILNNALPNIEEELRQLGLYDDPAIYINAEYVMKSTNVKEYPSNFIALHNLKKFDEKRNITDLTRNKDYNQEALDNLAAAITPEANKIAPPGDDDPFSQVYSTIPTRKKENVDINLESILSQNVSIKKTADETIQGSLQQLLDSVGVNPKHMDKKAFLDWAGGKKEYALSKNSYLAVMRANKSLSELVGEDESAQKVLQDGVIITHATILLGEEILKSLESDFGDVYNTEEEGGRTEEGIMVNITDYPEFKITGRFIIESLDTVFTKKEADKGVTKKITGLFPGSFKPPHAGHHSVVKAMQGIPNINQIVVLISTPVDAIRSSRVTPEKAKAIWAAYLHADPIGVDVDIKISKHPSPIRSAYEYIEESAENNEVVLLATSTADGDYYPQATVDKSASKNPNGGVQARAFIVPACRAEGCDTVNKMSAGDMRKIIDKPEITEQEKQNLFAYMHPNLTDEQKEGILALLVGERPETPEDIPEDELEEASSMAGGNVGISAGTFTGLNINKENEEERQRTKANEHNTNRETNYQYIPDERKNKMSVKQLLEEKQKLEEYALRKYIRNLIHRKAEENEHRLAEEQTLRLYIRQMLKEAKVEDAPTKSTGINKLISVLKVIIPQIEKAYKGLTTDKAQRDSFIKHYVHAIINTLSPQKAMRTAYEPADVDAAMPTMAENLLREQEMAPDPSKFLDIGIRTEEEKETEATAAEEEKKVAKAEETETKKKDNDAFEDIAGEKQLFPEIPGLDLTGRDESIDIYKKTIAAITRTYASLHNDKDEEHFEDYLVTNILLYKDTFEAAMADELPDITTPELEAARAAKEKYTGPTPTTAPAPVEEIIKSAVADLISEQLY